MDELFDQLKEARFFSKIGLCSGYHQVCIHVNDISKITFYICYGDYEFLVMPFGLANVPTTFMMLMDNVLRKYSGQFVVVFLDNILVYSSSLEEHLQHLKLVFQMLCENHLYAKSSNCDFV